MRYIKATIASSTEVQNRTDGRVATPGVISAGYPGGEGMMTLDDWQD
jgi:hypothetical protein